MKTKLLIAILLAHLTGMGQITGTGGYCQAEFDGGSFPQTHYISSFSFGNFTNVSGPVQQPFPHYIFYNNLSPGPYHQGSPYPVSIDVDSIGNKHLDMFIEYNRDGFFDLTERVLSIGVNAGTTNITGIVSIPSGINGLTRLRLVLFEDSGYMMAPACFTQLDWGETEDYEILIQQFSTSITEHSGVQTIYSSESTVFIPDDMNAEKIFIYSLSGRLLFAKELNNEKMITADIPEGIYIVSVLSMNEWQHGKLVMK